VKRRPLRLLHTSDVHVGGGFTTPNGGEHDDVCRCPVEAIVAAAHTHRVDAVLVVGDLFDHGRVAADVIARSLARLGGLDVPTVLVPGNHDVHHDDGLYRRHAAALDDSGLHFLGDLAGSTLELFDGALHLWGKAIDDHHPGYRPLHDAPCGRPDPDAWYVALGHGHYVGNEDPAKQMRSSPITATDIAATRADYVALGHWHVRTDVSEAEVPAWYCGSPLLSWGDGGGLVVDLDPDSGVKVQHVDMVSPPAGCA